MSPRRTTSTNKPAPESVDADKEQVLCAVSARQIPNALGLAPSVAPTDRHLIPVAAENITVIFQEAARLLDRISATIPEAAILTGMPEKRIRQAIYARELPVVQFTKGKEYYIAVDDLRAWFNKKKSVL